MNFAEKPPSPLAAYYCLTLQSTALKVRLPFPLLSVTMKFSSLKEIEVINIVLNIGYKSICLEFFKNHGMDQCQIC